MTTNLCQVIINVESKTKANLRFELENSIQPIQSAFIMLDRRQPIFLTEKNKQNLGALCNPHPSGMLKAFTNRSIACLNVDYHGTNIVPAKVPIPFHFNYVPSLHISRAEVISCSPPSQCERGNVSAYNNNVCSVQYNKLTCDETGVVIKTFRNRFEPKEVEIVQGTNILWKNEDGMENGIHGIFDPTTLDCIGVTKNISVGVHEFFHSRFPNQVSTRIHVCESETICTHNIHSLQTSTLQTVPTIIIIIISISVVSCCILGGIIRVLHGNVFNYMIEASKSKYNNKTVPTESTKTNKQTNILFSDLLKIDAKMAKTHKQGQVVYKYNSDTKSFTEK